MNVDEYLSIKGITLDQVVEAAQAVLHLAAGDSLFLSGSLVEGIGNARSDLDLFLLTDRHDIDFSACLTDVGIVVGPCLVDVRVLQHVEVDRLVERFEQWAAKPRVPRRSFELLLDERKFLHRLQIGRPLYGEERFRALRARVDPRALGRHKLDWARHLASSYQVDLAGLWGDGDHLSMILVGQELLGHAADALVAAHGDANPNTKWRMRQLGRLPPDWEEDLAGRRSGLSPVDRYLALHRPPDPPTPAAVRSWAFRAVAFSRSAFPAAERALLSPEPPSSLPSYFVPGSPADGSPALPALGLDVEMRYNEGHFEVVHLNERGPGFRLSEEAYAALCLFDGETRAAETRLPAALVDDMTTLVRYSRFEAPEVVDEELLQRILGLGSRG